MNNFTNDDTNLKREEFRAFFQKSPIYLTHFFFYRRDKKLFYTAVTRSHAICTFLHATVVMTNTLKSSPVILHVREDNI